MFALVSSLQLWVLNIVSSSMKNKIEFLSGTDLKKQKGPSPKHGTKDFFRDTTHIDRHMTVLSNVLTRRVTCRSTYDCALSSASSGVFFTQTLAPLFTNRGSLRQNCFTLLSPSTLILLFYYNTEFVSCQEKYSKKLPLYVSNICV